MCHQNNIFRDLAEFLWWLLVGGHVINIGSGIGSGNGVVVRSGFG